MYPIGYGGGVPNLISDDTYSYATYYSDPDGGLIVAQILRSTGAVTTHTMAGTEYTALGLPVYGDTHCYTTIGRDGLGYLHVWANMHAGDPAPQGTLRYVKSNAPDDISGWSDASASLPRGSIPSELWTYPTPIQGVDGTLRLWMRVGGGSGQSDSWIWTRGPSATSWSGPIKVYQGLSVPNAKGAGIAGDGFGTDTVYNWSMYGPPPFVEDHGNSTWTEHWFWNSRPLHTSGTDILPSYMQYRSATGLWYNAAGTTVTLPVDPVNTVSVQTGLVPSNDVSEGGIYLDIAGHPHWVMSRNPFSDIWYDGTAWQKNEFGSYFGYTLPAPASVVVDSPINPVLLNQHVFYIFGGAAAAGQPDFPTIARADGSSATTLGPAYTGYQDAVNRGIIYPGRWCGFPDQYQLRKTGTVELLYPDSGNQPRLLKFSGIAPAAPPYVPPIVSDQVLLDGGLPVRSDTFQFTLLDGTGATIGTLDVDEGAVPTLRFDTTRTTNRTLTGVQIMRSDLLAIDTEHERLRVDMVLQNGSVYPLGTFMFGQDNQALSSFGNLLTPELFDSMFLIQQGIRQTLAVPTGGSLYGLLVDTLAPFLSLDQITIDVLDEAATAPLLFLAGTSGYDVIAQAATLLGCFPPYFNNENVLRFRLPLQAGDTQVDHVYLEADPAANVAGRIFDETIQFANASYKAPNRYIVVGSDPAAPVVGVYDLPASASNSAANRNGRISTVSRTVQGLTDPALALHLAYMDSLTDRTTYSTVSFGAIADPRHDGFDTMNVLNVRYLETAWEMQLVSGGQHTHQGAVLWVP